MSRRLAICPGTAEYECLELFSRLRTSELDRKKIQEESVLWQTRYNTLVNRLPPSDNLFAGQTPPNRKTTQKRKK